MMKGGDPLGSLEHQIFGLGWVVMNLFLVRVLR